MKLEKAFSKDIKKNITAQEADNQFERNIIRSKFNFSCPDKNCNASVTCANLERPKAQRKRKPYYKVVSEHSPQCEIAKDIKYQKRSTTIQSDLYSSEDEYRDNAIRLNLQSPCVRRPKVDNSMNNSSDEQEKIKKRNENESSKRKIQATKTLSSLIDSYLAQESLDIQLPGKGTINIKNLFIEVNGQNLKNLTDHFRIYFGKAWFNKKENGYSIVFDKTLRSNKLAKRPSTYISKKKLEESGFLRFNISTLEKISDGKPKMVFILCETIPRIKNGYINFWCEGPEYLDYRPLTNYSY